jgi:DNA-binding MarR family transcriptional regulator
VSDAAAFGAPGGVHDTAAFGASMRRLLNRRELAATRHRAAVAQLLGVHDREMLAIGYLAQRGALAPATLGALLNLSSAGVTAMVQRMEAAGQLVRADNPADRRSILVRLAPRLVARAEQAFAPLVTELQQLAEEVPPEDRAAVGRFLARVAAASEEHADRLVAELGSRGRAAPALPAPGLWG